MENGSELMIITTQDLQAYTICPMLCKFNTHPPVDPLLKALKRALNYLYSFEMSNHKKVTEESMMSKWDKIWKQGAGSIDDKLLAERAMDGWLIIKKFMNKAYLKNKQVPRVVSLEHKTHIQRDIFLQTVFDVVLQGKQENITLLEFSTTRNKNLIYNLEADIEARAKLYLLKKSIGRSNCELIRYGLDQNVNKVSIKATKTFMEDTEDIILGIINNIKDELFYPSPTCKCKHPDKCRP